MHITHNETHSWEIETVMLELKENGPPKDVQETMNRLVNKAGDKFSVETLNFCVNLEGIEASLEKNA